MLISGKGDIQRNSLRSPRLRIRVPAKAFIPPRALILARLRFLLFFLLFLLFALLIFLLGLLRLLSPMLQVQEPALVEPDVRLSIALEVDSKRLVSDDGLVLPALAVEDLGIALLDLVAERSAFGDLQATDEGPLARLIVSLFPRLAIMPQHDVALLPLLLV